eukprot:m.324788 g.324788  ORF g.324788 m.324788 type:complete len:67 (-) comp19730_c1_seq20:2638-2838(-)
MRSLLLRLAKQEIKTMMTRYDRHLQTSPWKGLPELCNENGSYCADSCPTQAWSASTMLDVLYDMQS